MVLRSDVAQSSLPRPLPVTSTAPLPGIIRSVSTSAPSVWLTLA